jgi:hypothetical protein
MNATLNAEQFEAEMMCWHQGGPITLALMPPDIFLIANRLRWLTGHPEARPEDKAELERLAAHFEAMVPRDAAMMQAVIARVREFAANGGKEG